MDPVPPSNRLIEICVRKETMRRSVVHLAAVSMTTAGPGCTAYINVMWRYWSTSGQMFEPDVLSSVQTAATWRPDRQTVLFTSGTSPTATWRHASLINTGKNQITETPEDPDWFPEELHMFSKSLSPLSSSISAVAWSLSGEYVVSVDKSRRAVLWSDIWFSQLPKTINWEKEPIWEHVCGSKGKRSARWRFYFYFILWHNFNTDINKGTLQFTL